MTEALRPAALAVLAVPQLVDSLIATLRFRFQTPLVRAQV